MDASGRSALGERKDPVNVEMQTLKSKAGGSLPGGLGTEIRPTWLDAILRMFSVPYCCLDA